MKKLLSFIRLLFAALLAVVLLLQLLQLGLALARMDGTMLSISPQLIPALLLKAALLAINAALLYALLRRSRRNTTAT